MQKSLLTSMANLIKKFDVRLFGLPSDSAEAIKIRTARTAIIDVIFESGHELAVDYKIVKSTEKRTVQDF